MRAVMVILGFMSCIAGVAFASQGLAVYYDPKPVLKYTPSACYGYEDKGIMVAGVSDALWQGRRACGKRYRVSCIGPANTFPNPCKPYAQVVVTVVDYCSPTCNGDINLSRDAFQQIANPLAGKVKISYVEV